MSSQYRKLPCMVRRRRVMHAWVAALLLSLLGQLLLPLQTHTQWRIDDRGRLVEVCTLQGLQSVRLNPDTGEVQVAVADPGISPAMVFSALLAHAAVASGLMLPMQHDRAGLPAAQRSVRGPLPPDLLDTAIRGPPVIPA